MGKIVVFGTSMFSAELQKILALSGEDVVAFSVDEKYMSGQEFCGLPVYPFERIGSLLDMKDTSVLLSLGYSCMNEYRKNKYYECKDKGYNLFTFISPNAIVLTEKIGEGSIVMPGSYIGPFSEIGISTVVRAGTILSHHDKVGCFNWLADGCTFGGDVTIGDNCFIGLGSTIRNEITIEDYTFVGAHAYLGNSTQCNSVYLGVPAKKVEDIDSFSIIRRV